MHLFDETVGGAPMLSEAVAILEGLLADGAPAASIWQSHWLQFVLLATAWR